MLQVLPVSRNSQMLTFTFQNGCVATLRTSGTEPKIKYYAEMCALPGLRSAFPSLGSPCSRVCFLHRNLFRYGIVVCVGRDLKDHPIPPLCCVQGLLPLSQAAPAWPWTLPGLGQPQLLWAPCARACPPDYCRVN